MEIREEQCGSVGHTGPNNLLGSKSRFFQFGSNWWVEQVPLKCKQRALFLQIAYGEPCWYPYNSKKTVDFWKVLSGTFFPFLALYRFWIIPLTVHDILWFFRSSEFLCSLSLTPANPENDEKLPNELIDNKLDYSKLLLAKSCFSVRQYRRAAHLLVGSTNPKSIFIRCYALYLVRNFISNIVFI